MGGGELYIALATWTYYMKRTRIVVIEIRHKVISKATS